MTRARVWQIICHRVVSPSFWRHEYRSWYKLWWDNNMCRGEKHDGWLFISFEPSRFDSASRGGCFCLDGSIWSSSSLRKTSCSTHPLLQKVSDNVSVIIEREKFSIGWHHKQFNNNFIYKNFNQKNYKKRVKYPFVKKHWFIKCLLLLVFKLLLKWGNVMY